MGEFGPSARIFQNPDDAKEVWTETVRLATESGFKGFAVWTLESHNQTECWNILADDGKFDLFLQLVSIHTGLEIPEGGEGGGGEQESAPESAPESKPESTPESVTESKPSQESKPKKGCGSSATGVGLSLLILPAIAIIRKRKD